MKTIPLVPPAPMTSDSDGGTPITAPGADDVSAVVPDAARTEELRPAIVAAISTVYDPEIPVNIWELGLIYDVAVNSAGVAAVRMTLTAPGCPAAQWSRSNSRARSIPIGPGGSGFIFHWDFCWE